MAQRIAAIIQVINRIEKPAVFLFFAAYLAIGLAVFRDYGISWDEPISRTRGILALQYVVHGDQELLRADWKYHHGSAFEASLVAMEAILHISQNPRAIYLARHLATFLLFYAGVVAFYFLGKRIFNNRGIALLGSLLLVLNPRIFAHSFYNPKDIPFLALFIIALYSMVCFLDKKTYARAAFHGAACALLVDVRAAGVIVPVVTLLYLVHDYLRSMRPLIRRTETVTPAAGTAFSVPILLGGFVLASIPVSLNLISVAEKFHPALINGAFLLLLLIVPGFVALQTGNHEGKNIARCTAVYGVCAATMTALFWPILWPNPVVEFGKALTQAGTFPWPYTILYMGEYRAATELPWHYIPVWIGISTPLLYLFLFVCGLLISGAYLALNPVRFVAEQRNHCICLISTVVPLLAAMGTKPVLYDDWRQLYFVYPVLILVALRGLTGIVAFGKASFSRPAALIIKSMLGTAITVSLLVTIGTMVRFHPLQNLYFNRLAGKTMEDIKRNYDLDYWGISYKKALEYIVRHDSSQDITVYAATYPAKANLNLLADPDQKRVRFVDLPSNAQYFVGNYRWHSGEYDMGQELYAAIIDGAKIVVACKLSGSPGSAEPSVTEHKFVQAIHNR